MIAWEERTIEEAIAAGRDPTLLDPAPLALAEGAAMWKQGVGQRAAIARRWKLIRRWDGDELYDLTTDPGETTNLWGRVSPTELAELQAAVEGLPGGAAGAGVDLTPAERAHLRALGYEE